MSKKRKKYVVNNIQPKMIKGLKNIHLHGDEIAKADDEHYKKSNQKSANDVIDDTTVEVYDEDQSDDGYPTEEINPEDIPF